MSKNDEKEALKCLSYPVYIAPGKTVLFGEIVNRDDFDKKQNCVPVNWPKPRVQFERNCGIYAGAISMECNGTSESPIPPARKRDEKSDTKISEKRTSVREIAKKNGVTEWGPIFDIALLSKLLGCFKIKGTQILNLPMHALGEPYLQAICDLLIKGNTIIIASDVKLGFPAKNKAIGCHWALIFGYIYLKTVKFLVTQYGNHYLWDGKDLFDSNKLMPIMNPHCGIYLKTKSITSVSTYKKVFVDEKQELPKSQFRRIKEKDLLRFRFTGLAVPAPTLKEKVLEFNS